MKRKSVHLTELLARFFGVPLIVERANRVNDIFGCEIARSCCLNVACLASPAAVIGRKLLTEVSQFGASGAMNCTVDTAPAGEFCVGRVHDRIRVLVNDIAKHEFNAAIREFSNCHRGLKSCGIMYCHRSGGEVRLEFRWN